MNSYRYAQLNENDICLSDSQLSTDEHDNSSDMIRLTESEPSPLGKQFNRISGDWTDVIIE